MRRKYLFNKKKNYLYIMTIIMISLFLFFYIYVEKNIKPKLIAMSEIKARLYVTQVINEAVSKKIELNSFDNLIIIKTDNIGKVTLVTANTKEMNRLAVETSKDIQKELEDIKRNHIKIRAKIKREQ